MSRYLMLAMVGALLSLLVLDVFAIWGLSKATNSLKKDMVKENIVRDVAYFLENTNLFSSNLEICQSSLEDINELSSIQVHDSMSRIALLIPQIKIAQTAQNIANCQVEKMEQYIKQGNEIEAKKFLLSFLQAIYIASWHTDTPFTEDEKKILTDLADSTKESQFLKKMEGAHLGIANIINKINRKRLALKRKQ